MDFLPDFVHAQIPGGSGDHGFVMGDGPLEQSPAGQYYEFELVEKFSNVVGMKGGLLCGSREDTVRTLKHFPACTWVGSHAKSAQNSRLAFVCFKIITTHHQSSAISCNANRDRPV